ncbi:hypothetical protein GE21DRAFT_7501 [Neurospora crassa]|uniref:Uncharacterized protein n=2 Tax=Neurospora crassa TaxID=5141 RepID=Q1K893_NEUCR|nr:hypothetical protein NCU01079 [Neurospora crassa OR74A]EAA32455.1 hypothetical protein NCU01079 [Neurospora crassa OR74A]KHE88299.1 hypothetical protein GE21DRAFT_7501 [Neurospora crassa]CAD21312.1 hypothetical protein [Neurospora crassa]|eukprot:XP_961691.1 hypothetical protein NCU01079 [Neurospora crassa OR74A]
MTNPDPFQNGNDTNALPFLSPRQGWDEDPIATCYLRALNQEIRARKSDYDLACSSHTYIKMAVLSLRSYLQEWEELMGEIIGFSNSETERELVSSEGVDYERLKELDEYREVLKLMDTPFRPLNRLDSQDLPQLLPSVSLSSRDDVAFDVSWFESS